MSEQPQPRPSGPQPPNFQVRIPLEWADDEDVPIVYANQVLVSHGGPEFFVVFGVVLPPTNPNELPDVLQIRPQVRVVVSRDSMASIVKALNDNLHRYEHKLEPVASPSEPGEDQVPPS